MKHITFADCGLDINNNILQAPKCTCGCGQYANLILKDDNDVSEFIGSMLHEDDCEHCAIFALKQDGSMIFGQKTDEEILLYKLNGQDTPSEIVNMQEQLQFHCYGLLEQVDEDLYAIIMQ